MEKWHQGQEWPEKAVSGTFQKQNGKDEGTREVTKVYQTYLDSKHDKESEERDDSVLRAVIFTSYQAVRCLFVRILHKSKLEKKERTEEMRKHTHSHKDRHLNEIGILALLFLAPAVFLPLFLAESVLENGRTKERFSHLRKTNGTWTGSITFASGQLSQKLA